MLRKAKVGETNAYAVGENATQRPCGSLGNAGNRAVIGKLA
jgi:hypothetical protein